MELLIAILIGIGAATGAYFVGSGIGYTTGYGKGVDEAPKTNMVIQDVRSTTTVTSEQRTEQNQAQIVVNCYFNEGRKTELVIISISNLTNLLIDRSDRSNSNYIVTNLQ